MSDDNFDNNPAEDSETSQATGAVNPSAAEFQRLQDDLEAVRERLFRATADARNMQKRIETEKEQGIQYANEKLLKSLLPVIDNFERALAVDPKTTDTNKLLQGMQIVHDQMMKVLRQAEVEEIAPEPGTPFDPAHHHALMQQDDDRYDQPTVTQLMQKGYTVYGRTLRPAGVAVSKGK
jgi:molecular chaperone GrpE